MVNPLSYNHPRKDENLLDKIFLKPNLPLAVWFFSWLLTKMLPYGNLNFIFALIAYGAGFTWAWLELFQGTHWFRRILGFIVLVWLIASQIT